MDINDRSTRDAGDGAPKDADPAALSRRAIIGKGVAAGLGAAALGAAGLTPALAASDATRTATRRRAGTVTIQYAALQDQTGELANEIKRFNQLHSGRIYVEYQQLPPVATDQYSKFTTAFQAQSSTPDVVQIDVTWPAQFAPLGWLAPLDGYVKSGYLSQFWPSAQSVGKVNGKLYGIQRYMDIGLLYYRTDLVRTYNGGKAPATRDQLVSVARKIVSAEGKNGVKYGYLLPGKKIEAIVDEWLELVWGAGGNIGNPGSLKLDGATSVAALQYMYDTIYTTKLAPQGTSTYAPNDILALFQNGQAPFMRNWTFAYALANNPSKSKVAGKVGIAPTLTTSGHSGHGCTGGWVLGVNAYSSHKDEAWTFIDYMLNKETQTSLSLNAGLISSRPDVVNSSTIRSKRPEFESLVGILNAGYNRPKLRQYNQFTTPLQAAINGVLSNQSKPSDALGGVQSQVASLS